MSVNRILIILMIIINFISGELWVETTQGDFGDGIYERDIYSSNRNDGTIEFVPTFDLNNDGYLEIFTAGHYGPIAIYWGSSSGYNPGNKLEFNVGGGGNCESGDLNLDGYPDFVVSPGHCEFFRIYWGSPTGLNPNVYQEFPLEDYAIEANFVADLNKDGYLDIIIDSYSRNRAAIYWGRVSGYSPADTTLLPSNWTVHNIEVADFNKDSWLDICMVNVNGGYNYVYWGSPGGYSPGNLTFLPCEPSHGHGLSVADLDNNGYLDLVFTGFENIDKAYIYWGESTGFTTRDTLLTGYCFGGSSIADINRDGYLDILFHRGSDVVSLAPRIYWGSDTGYSNNNHTTIGLAIKGSGGVIADFNQDGFLDIFCNSYSNLSYIFWGPSFTTYIPLTVNYDHHAMFREIGNVYNRKYYEDYISSVFDAREEVDWGIVDWDDSLPPGASVTFAVRSGNTPNPDASWSDWDSLGKGDEIHDSLNSRYLQYRARLKYTNPAYLPYLYEVRIGYGPAVGLILEPNQADSTLPEVRVDYNIRVINIGIGLDTVDLVYQHNTNWLIGLFDSTGVNPLIDNNNNSIPDVIVDINDTVPIVLAVTPPSSAQGGDVDSLRLIGNSNINPSLVDSVYIITRIRRVVNILVEPDQIGWTYAGVPRSYNLWIYNQGTNRDTVDLYYQHNKPWGVALLDSTGTLPLTDHNNNGYPDLWVNSLDSVRFRLVIYSPDTASVGVADTLILTGRSCLDPLVTDNARIITIIEGVNAIIIFPDQIASGPPDTWVNFSLSCCNNQIFTDTIDLRYIDRLGYSYQLLDSLNNQLIDHNGNGLVDLPGVGSSGGEVDFNLRVLVPANAPSGIRDTILVYGYSGRDTTVRDSSVCILVVGVLAQVRIDPDRVDSASCGDTIDYLLWVNNLGNGSDVIDLSIIGGDFGYSLRDLNGDLLTDTDGDGIVDLGLINGFGGCESLVVRVVVPQANAGVIDTVLVRARSSNNTMVYDDAVLRTKSLGGVWQLVIERDQSDRVEVGKSVNYQLLAILQGSLSDYVNIRHSGGIGGWSVELKDNQGNLLKDNNQDGVADLDLVIPNLPEGFVVIVHAPDNFDLHGVLDSLVYFDLIVYGECSMAKEIRDSVFLRTYLVPPFEVHNFRNPFREQTRFMFCLPKSGRVNLEIYNRAGELVRRLITERQYNFGIHYYPWDGRNDAGERLAPGVYLYIFDFYADDGERITAKKKAVIIK